MSKNQDGSKQGFDAFDLHPSIRGGITRAGFDTPRPIQTRALPHALAGRDVLGLAQTGTGKTAAFALPILERIAKNPPSDRAPRALVVAPTRELAQQIAAEIELLGSKLPRLRTQTIYGGVSTNRQVESLRRGVDVVIACPGRLLDLLGQGAVSLAKIEVLVLDEADHMFDMGFLPDIRRIIAALPAKRQNLLFSATMPPPLRILANKLLRDPEVVDVGAGAPADTIEHALYSIEEKLKVDLLRRLFATDAFRSAIVFTRTKHRAKRLAQKLQRVGLRAIALQGNMSQRRRDEAMEGFRNQSFDVLVATDIAARGIDVAKVSHVINFDVPVTPDAYTHRIGRTGRAEQSGKAFTFVTAEDRSLVRAVERHLGSRIQRLETKSLPDVPPDGTPFEVVVKSAEPRARRPADPSKPKRRRTRRKPQASGNSSGVKPSSTSKAPSQQRRRRQRPSSGSGSGSGSAGERSERREASGSR